MVDIHYRRVLMLPADIAADWMAENGLTGSGWVGIQGDRAYVSDEPRPIRLGPACPGRVVTTPVPEVLAERGERFLLGGAEVRGDYWGLATRLHADEVDFSAARSRLGRRLMAGIQQMFARPCGTEGCEGKAINHGDLPAPPPEPPVASSGQRDHHPLTCKNGARHGYPRRHRRCE
jgi:hypothetical protein